MSDGPLALPAGSGQARAGTRKARPAPEQAPGAGGDRMIQPVGRPIPRDVSRLALPLTLAVLLARPGGAAGELELEGYAEFRQPRSS